MESVILGVTIIIIGSLINNNHDNQEPRSAVLFDAAIGGLLIGLGVILLILSIK